ncbi:MAG: ABC transporter substrate-binding protein [Oscillospiraceae bacterium]|nr:ABC transporter substrate-binding protein [Oscillospiraceae bacterium]
MKKIVLLLALVLLLTGCASEKAYIPTGDGLADVAPPTTAPTEPDVEAPGGLFATAASFTLAYYPDEGFNPYDCLNINNRMLFSLLYQSLFTTDSNYRVEPQLCQSYTVSEDLTTYYFTLAQATFADGTALTAMDVVESLKEAADSDYYEGRFRHIKSISEAEGNRVKIVTDIPMEQLPLLLDIPIVKYGQSQELTPQGTGPYVLQDTPEGAELVRRENWWTNVQVPLTAKRISLMVGQNPTQIRDEFEFGDVGISTADPGSASYAAYRCDYELWDADTGIFLYLGCNIKSEVFSQAQVRVALSYAIDRQSLLSDCYNGFGTAVTLPAIPSSPFYDLTLARQVSYDPVKLQEALAESSLTGRTVKLLVNKTDSIRLQAARKIAQMLTDCGLNVEMLECNYTDYRAVLRDGTFDLYLGQTKLSPNMDLSEFFREDGNLSWGGMANATCLDMCQEALENSGNYYNLHQMVLRNSQLVPVLFRSHAVYADRGLGSGMEPSRDNVFYYSMGRSIEEARTVVPNEE